MDKKDLKIIFLGNPEFARYHLEKIIDAGFNVVAVVSAPDKPAGRGMKFSQTAVTKFAKEKNIDCLQPTNLKNQEFIEKLKSYKADIQVVIAFRMLPVAVWDMPPLGTINLHASLLPQYRGAAPINWAIINGEKHSGVSTFKLKHEIDTGNLILQKECTIEADDNAGTLHDKLMVLGAETMVETLSLIAEDKVIEIEQVSDGELKSAPKIFSETTQVDWNNSANDLHNFIRGLSPYPVAKTKLDGKQLKIFDALVEHMNHNHKPGSVFTDGKKMLKVSCLDGYIHLLDLQIQGKKRMKINDFLNGYDVKHLNSI